jgi:2-polyprenyl-3-methyl-5-hydroxy-6-metoxy-1,4-benzoquinol methylase
MLRRRRLQPELMDQPGLDAGLHRGALAGLARLNVVCRSAAILWPEIAAAARRVRPTALKVLDLACGGGDNAIEISRRASREGLDIQVHGCDISPVAIDESRRRCQQAGAANVSFSQLDVLRQPLAAGYDAVISSLFLHHLEKQQAIELLRKMAAAAGQFVLVCDLRRTAAGYALAWAGSRLLTGSPIVHVDAPRSVAAAFDVSEVRALARQSGLDGATIARRWPQRWLLSWRRG